MTYTSATITSTTPAKDLMAALNPALTAAGYTLVDSYGSPNLGAVWTGVTYGNGTYVAVANATATAASSTDGITWTQRSLPVSAGWNSIAYGNGVFAAVASGAAAAVSSPDGITWTQRTAPAAYNAVTYGGGLFVAVGNGQPYATSPDGITWTARSLPVAALAYNWTAIAYGGGQFVTVSAGTSMVFTSPDGITWTQRASQTSLNWASVAYGAGAGLFVQVASNTAGNVSVATSPTGATWTTRPVPTALQTVGWSSVTYGNGLFVVLPSGSGLQSAITSPDGITWTQRSLPAGSTWMSGAYGAAGGFVAVSSANAYAGSSPDGITWGLRSLTATSTTATADVYRSPAANNTFGQDWYLILRRNADTGTAFSYQVAEGYDAGSHLMSAYGGIGVQTMPGAGGVNPMPAGAPDAMLVTSLTLTTTAFTWRLSVTGDRVVLGLRTGAELGFYAGLYDDLLPAGVTKVPLVCATFPTGQNQATSIGFTNTAQQGGFTREPATAQAQSSAGNFDARIHNGYWYWLSVVTVGMSYTPLTSAAALYGNPSNLTRTMLGGGKGGGTVSVGDALRGLLKDCWTVQVSSAAGDTATAGGRTYVRVGGPTATLGFFVDQAV